MEDTALPDPSNGTGTDGSQSDQQAIMMQQIEKMAEELAKLQKKEELREARRQNAKRVSQKEKRTPLMMKRKRSLRDQLKEKRKIRQVEALSLT
ncbi:hypothetical protein M0R45_008686 [Rubus argutus]|uniref:Uncharacterized protein n=1 Tax=Rubus argutus TaxID=59490 RepID=A0AAW1Y4F8_RUBAR